MILSQHQQQLTELFALHRNWEDRYRLIMRLGKTLPPLAPELKIDSALLSGCESKVWFYGEYQSVSQRLSLSIDSDAKIIKGLISIIVTAHQDLNQAQVRQFDCVNFLEQLGLLSHLSPSRGNGIKAIIEAIAKIEQ
jgi:cysteine desulfuration protein SufE